MAGAVLVRNGAVLRWVAEDGAVVREEPLARSPDELADLLAGEYAGVPPAARRSWATAGGSAPIVAEPSVARAIRAAGGAVADARPPELRRVREGAAPPTTSEARRWLLPVARRAAEEALRSPDEMLIALVREESRLERALGRERGAEAQWVGLATGPLGEHAEAARRFGDAFARHHGELERRIEGAVRDHLPNLSAVVGPKVAGRLLAEAGSRRALARISGSRLQMLGTRRRPDPERGPRFGVIFRAPGMETLPDDRRGRYARSLAAIAAIAARIDAFGGADRGKELVARRDRRLAALGERRR